MSQSRERPSSMISSPPGAQPLEHELDVLRAIRDTSFGTIEVTIHQSRIVQITRSEKVRFDPN